MEFARNAFAVIGVIFVGGVFIALFWSLIFTIWDNISLRRAKKRMEKKMEEEKYRMLEENLLKLVMSCVEDKDNMPKTGD